MFEVTHGGLLQILLSSGTRHGALSLIASSEKKIVVLFSQTVLRHTQQTIK